MFLGYTLTDVLSSPQVMMRLETWYGWSVKTYMISTELIAPPILSGLYQNLRYASPFAPPFKWWKTQPFRRYVIRGYAPHLTETLTFG